MLCHNTKRNYVNLEKTFSFNTISFSYFYLWEEGGPALQNTISVKNTFFADTHNIFITLLQSARMHGLTNVIYFDSQLVGSTDLFLYLKFHVSFVIFRTFSPLPKGCSISISERHFGQKYLVLKNKWLSWLVIPLFQLFQKKGGEGRIVRGNSSNNRGPETTILILRILRIVSIFHF